MAFNNRTILYFGGNFWVIDQPSDKGMVWLANSPIGDWSKLKPIGLKLYGSEEKEIEGANGEYIDDLTQNVSGGLRYSKNKNEVFILPNYWYAIQDDEALTYVMTYPVNDEGFEKTTKKCLADFQCFRNKKDNRRLIVPPNKKKYTVSSVLGNRYKGLKAPLRRGFFVFADVFFVLWLASQSC
ncbi:MAG: hypothetical protein MJY82_01195 [Fibrobacter sp.]|nr:hypothetical protein [Fibrobacter sp.]